jgi:hypothetical protein
MYATVSIEPTGNRVACRYDAAHQTDALHALNNMGHGVTLLRPADDENFDHYPEWEYYPGIGWVA